MRFGLRKGWAAIGALGIVITATAIPDSAAASTGSDRPTVVLLGTGGLRWSDVTSEQTALSSLRETAATGLLSVRSVRSSTCPTDGWLAVSAGARARDSVVEEGQEPCRDPELTVAEPGGTGTVESWDRYVTQAQEDSYDARPGLLGDSLAAGDVSSAAVGAGAAVALSDGSGEVAHAWAGGTGLAADVESALATDPDLLAVDLGAIVDPGTATSVSRADQVDALDQRLTAVMAEIPSGTTVIVASLADSGTKGQLRLLAATGYGDALLGSSSTRQDGLVQTTDLLPTLLSSVGIAVPDQAVGSRIQAVAGDSGTRLSDLDEAANAIRPINQPFLQLLCAAQIVLYLAVALAIRRSGRRFSPVVRWGALVLSCVPASAVLAGLLPWWRADRPGLAIVGAMLAFVVPMTLIAGLGPWRRVSLGPLGAVGGMTMLAFAGDAVTGSSLMLSGLLGYDPVVAGRFYGFGNMAFAVFVTGALLLAVAVADPLVRRGRRPAAASAVALIGAVAAVVDGTPGWGSDFGGPPAIIPAFAVLTLLTLGLRVTRRRAALVGGGTVAAIVLIAWLDWLRGPEARTHLGGFFQTVIDGGALGVIQRKAGANLHILFTSYLTLLFLAAVVFAVLVLLRPVPDSPFSSAGAQAPLLRAGAVTFGVMMLLGFLMNDSGVAIPAIAVCVALPLLSTVVLRLPGSPVPGPAELSQNGGGRT